MWDVFTFQGHDKRVTALIFLLGIVLFSQGEKFEKLFYQANFL